MPAAATAPPASSTAKNGAQKPIERKYKCTYCARAFSRSEHRSRHERSRKLFRTLDPVDGGVGGVVRKLLCPRFANSTSPAQTPKSDLSNAQNVEAPSCDETCFSDMIVPSTPKMEESRSSARSSDARAQNRPRQRPRQRQPHRSHPLAWIQRRWNK